VHPHPDPKFLLQDVAGQKVSSSAPANMRRTWWCSSFALGAFSLPVAKQRQATMRASGGLPDTSERTPAVGKPAGVF
jgi:hypothetical protein